MRFPTKQCLNGYSVACNRSKDIKARLPSEAIQHMSAIIVYKALKPCVDLFSVLINQTVSGPATAPMNKSATVRFIIRYVLRLRRWGLLAKTMRVKTLIIIVTINSVRNTANQMFFVPSIDIL